MSGARSTKSELNRSKVEPQKNDSESPHQVAIDRVKAASLRPWNRTILKRSILDSDLPIQFR